jgi:plastocyanin
MTQSLESPTVADHTPGRPTAMSKHERKGLRAELRGGAVSRKLTRLLFAASMVAGLSAPMLGAYAAGHDSSVDAWNPPKGFDVIGAKEPHVLEIAPNDTVSWNIMDPDGEHTVTPRDEKLWGGPGGGDKDHPLKPSAAADRYTKTFKTPGDYAYYCQIHDGMTGTIRVVDPAATTTTTAQSTPSTTQPPATTPTSAPATTPVTTATAPATGRPAPVTTAPAPTTTTAKPDKDKKPKDPKDEESTTTSSTLPPAVDIPDSAIIPALPGSTGSSSAQEGGSAEAPNSIPEGEAVALLKPKKGSGGDAVKLLIVSGIGLGALGIGTGAYKYANRSSKYFPA